MEFRFCPMCGVTLGRRRDGAHERPACDRCSFVQYRNPSTGVAVIVRRADTVLLGRRAGSYRDQWCIPCGYVEWEEDVRLAACREFREETGLEVRLTGVYAVHSNFHNPRQHTVGIWFGGEVIGGALVAGDGLVEVAYFPLTALPASLAFPTDRLVLEQLRRDLA